METQQTVSRDDVLKTLTMIYDPEIPVDIYELGLIYKVDIDDDRNVAFAQMVGLVQLLRANKIYHELTVIPDDVHETLLHSRWLYTFDRMETFLHRFLPLNR